MSVTPSEASLPTAARTGRHVVLAGDDQRPRHARALAARLAPALRTAVARPLLRPRAPRHAARDAPGAGALQCRGAADGLLPRRTPRLRDGAGSRGAGHLQRSAGRPRRDHARPARLARPVHAGAARTHRRGRRRRAAGPVVAAPLRQASVGVDGVAAGRAGEAGAGPVPARAASARARHGHGAPGRARSGRRQRRDRPAAARWPADRVAGGAARLGRLVGLAHGPVAQAPGRPRVRADAAAHRGAAVDAGGLPPRRGQPPQAQLLLPGSLGHEPGEVPARGAPERCAPRTAQPRHQRARRRLALGLLAPGAVLAGLQAAVRRAALGDAEGCAGSHRRGRRRRTRCRRGETLRTDAAALAPGRAVAAARPGR
jgi:hypothetical protein